MPSVERPGKKGVYIEFELDFLLTAQEFAKSRSESFKEVVVQALTRHMANPPPPPVPLPPPPITPLPPVTASEPVTGKPAAKKASKRGKK
ncbi:MAG TPA: hypothetical protein VG122_06045 [Gemmata sp.]|jgi:hypothetical protein|nr:hypothetical protein [Gemmata sp.]